MYFKIFNEADNHHGFQYKDGLNVDINDFQEKGLCVAGGLHFTDADNICEFLHYGKYIREVEVPENETQVVKCENEWRAKSLFLHPRKDLREVDTWKWMIENNINIKVLNNYAITWAAEYGHLNVVKLLSENGADCTANNNYVIQSASYFGHIEIVKFLLAKGADCTDYGNIAIKWANKNGHSEVVSLLLNHGAKLPK